MHKMYITYYLQVVGTYINHRKYLSNICTYINAHFTKRVIIFQIMKYVENNSKSYTVCTKYLVWRQCSLFSLNPLLDFWQLKHLSKCSNTNAFLNCCWWGKMSHHHRVVNTDTIVLPPLPPHFYVRACNVSPLHSFMYS